jgi:hypothetical protein
VGWRRKFFEITMKKSTFTVKPAAPDPMEVKIQRSFEWIVTNGRYKHQKKIFV